MVKNRPGTIVIYGALSFIFQVLALTIPIMLGYGLQSGVMVLAAIGFLKFMALTIYISRVGASMISLSILRPFAKLAIPTALTLIVGGSMPYIDSYIVLHYFDKSHFAIYQYGAREMPLVLLMANALSNVFSGDIAHAHLNKNIHVGLQQLKSSSAQLIHSLFPLTIILVLFSGFLFTHVYTKAFIGSAGIFNIFMLLTISRLIFPQTVLSALLKNKAQLMFSTIEWIVNLAFDFIFLYYFGLIGIAYATVFAYFLERALQVIFLSRLGYHPKDYIPIKTWAFYAACTLCAVVAVRWLV
jgi:O-antigen/teichoic acid export membrane protein